jgi:hypothetical protein
MLVRKKKKTTKKKQNSDTLNPQPAQNFSMPYYTEKLGWLSCPQMPAPNLLGRHRLKREQISSAQHSHSQHWDKPA